MRSRISGNRTFERPRFLWYNACMDTATFLKQLASLPGYKGQVVHVEHLTARKARYGQLERPLPAPLQAALKRVGAERLYSHQAQAINAARRGQHLILATGTASGKTLAYNVPVLEAIVADRNARALYLFPTKALAQDQLRSLAALTEGDVRGIRFGTYDGDTPQAARSRLRREVSVLLTNPDMLHVGILPNHNLWAGFFANLRFVVIDEAHVYRGVFGSHVANVLRRLWRVCARYGAAPQIIACSATIANPGEHLHRGGQRPECADVGAHRSRPGHRVLHPVVRGVPRSLHLQQHEVGQPLPEHGAGRGIRDLPFPQLTDHLPDR